MVMFEVFYFCDDDSLELVYKLSMFQIRILKWISTFGYAYVFFFLIAVCTHLRCYTINDVCIIMCTLCEKKQLKKNSELKKKDVLFSSKKFKIFFV
jgi:hypothetical protein